MMYETWADDYLRDRWDPIDVSSIIIPAQNDQPKMARIYLMRRCHVSGPQRTVEAKIVVPPFMDAEIYLKTDGNRVRMVPDIFAGQELESASHSHIRAKLEKYASSNSVVASFDPGPAYKHFLGTLKRYVGSVRYSGKGPIPFTEGIQHEEEIVRKFRSEEEAAEVYGQELCRNIQNPPDSGMLVKIIQDLSYTHAYGFYVILNRLAQKKLAEILRDQNKARRFHRFFLKQLESFIDRSMVASSHSG